MGLLFKKENINKIFVCIILFSFPFGLLFGQKTLDHELFLEEIKHSSDTIYRDCIKEHHANLCNFWNAPTFIRY